MNRKNGENKMTDKKKQPIKYFSMFSGIGGFEIGLQNSKYEFENCGYSEVDKYAISIYKRHFPEHRNYGDATKINTEELEDFDLLIGGFPCQAFSIAGKQRGFNDTRGTLFFEIARVLRDKKPKYFLLENVKNLLSHEGGRTIQTILEICDELGYDVSWKIYNSKNYGVPQNRERLFLKGYYRGECGREVFLKQKIGQESDGGLISLNKKKQAQKVYDINGVATTLCANGGGQGGKTGLYAINVTKEGNARALTTRQRDTKLSKRQDIYIQDIEKGNLAIRRLIPLECERLQGFPDNWTELGKDDEKISDTQRYKCVGNAVTTKVITSIINEMFDEEQ